jgi:SAM-dependent methyltransferase
MRQFEEKIYNDKYVEVDPDYVEARPKANAAMLIKAFGEKAYQIKHLDFGGGDGLLTKILNQSNWQSKSYDPFVHRDIDIKQLGKFDLITAYEVFEHVPDVQTLMSNLRFLLNKNGLVLFSTLLTDGNIHPGGKLNWWYASPRNGHISLFSKQSLVILSTKFGFKFGSFSRNTHFFFTTVPPWAQHLIRGA